MRATPAAPATQPRPNSGMRLTSWRSPNPGGQPRLQCRYGEPGNRRRKDDVDLRRLDLGLVERCEQRLLSQVEGDFDESIVCLGEAAQLAVSR